MQLGGHWFATGIFSVSRMVICRNAYRRKAAGEKTHHERALRLAHEVIILIVLIAHLSIHRLLGAPRCGAESAWSNISCGSYTASVLSDVVHRRQPAREYLSTRQRWPDRSQRI